MHDPSPTGTPLGERSSVPQRYAPELLEPLPRATGRALLEDAAVEAFAGYDLWNAYEVSWLHPSGKPVVATGRLRLPASSPFLLESKSLKLYLMSLHGHVLADVAAAQELLQGELSARAGAPVDVELFDVGLEREALGPAPGTCIDSVELSRPRFDYAPELLDGCTSPPAVEETLHSNLFVSNCPVTGQPDWATVIVSYRGPRIAREALLAYLVSYRQHQGFHEHCVERIFQDLWTRARPHALTVDARFTRRGGLDINPVRSSLEPHAHDTRRLWRQ